MKKLNEPESPVSLNDLVKVFEQVSGQKMDGLSQGGIDTPQFYMRHFFFLGARLWTQANATEVGAIADVTHGRVLEGVGEAAKRLYANVSPMKEFLQQCGLQEKYKFQNTKFIPGFFFECYETLKLSKRFDPAIFDPRDKLERLLAKRYMSLEENEIILKGKLGRARVRMESNALMKLHHNF